MTESFVLIHGAWHSGWCWRPIADRLRAAGHRVVTPTLPGLADGDDPTAHSLEDVIDFVVELIGREDLSNVVLVGHSWAGYVITGVAPRVRSRLSRLVYWSAFVPGEGVPLLGELAPEHQEHFTTLAELSGNNSISLPFESWSRAFIQDASEEVQRLTHAFLVPHPMQYNTASVPALDPARLDIPTAYLLGSDDLTMRPGDLGSRFATRLGVRPTVIPGSHELFFTAPQTVSAALLSI